MSWNTGIQMEFEKIHRWLGTNSLGMLPYISSNTHTHTHTHTEISQTKWGNQNSDCALHLFSSSHLLRKGSLCVWCCSGYKQADCLICQSLQTSFVQFLRLLERVFPRLVPFLYSIPSSLQDWKETEIFLDREDALIVSILLSSSDNPNITLIN